MTNTPLEELWDRVVGGWPQTRDEQELYNLAASASKPTPPTSDALPPFLEDGGCVLSPMDLEGTRYALQRIQGFGSDLSYVGKIDYEGVARHALPEDATNAQRARFAKLLRFIVVPPEPEEAPEEAPDGG